MISVVRTARDLDLEWRGAGCWPPPAWARWAAHLAALTPVPTSLWRLTLAAGFHGGYTDSGYAALDVSPTGALYLIVLSVLIEAFALLTIGLVRAWGEWVPAWIPVVGGRAVRPRIVTGFALTGAAILCVVWTPFLVWWTFPHDDLTPTGSILVGFLYLPLVAWGPLLAAVALDYQRRHRPSG